MKDFFSTTTIISLFTVLSFTCCKSGDKIEALLEKEVATENAKCPMRLNENVYFDSCKLSSDRIIEYHYRLAFSGMDSSLFINQYKPMMIEQLKKQPTAVLYQKENVGFRYIYNNMNNEYLFQINIVSKDYDIN